MTRRAPCDSGSVAGVAAFASLDPKAIERLIASASIVFLEQGDLLFREGEPEATYFIVIAGLLKLYRNTFSGEEIVIRVVARGETIAGASIFTDSNHLTSAEAICDTRILQIPGEHLMRCIREVPDIAVAMVSLTSQHVHDLVLHVEQLKAQSGVQRVAEFLAALCSVDHGPCTVALPYDKVLIARRLGIKPESLSRAFAKLLTIGVQVQGSHIAVSEVALLHRLATDTRRLPESICRRQRDRVRAL